MQEDIDKLEWSKEWEMKSNLKKCKVVAMAKYAKRSLYNYEIGNGLKARPLKEKDLREHDSSPDKHVAKISGKIYKLLKKY